MGASREKVRELVADYQAARSKFFPRLVLTSYYDRVPPNRFSSGGALTPFELFKREGVTCGYGQTDHFRRLKDPFQHPGHENRDPGSGAGGPAHRGGSGLYGD